MEQYKSGSRWRKWDLHLHTPKTKLNDQYQATGSMDIWDIFCEKVETSDVAVFGITDYFSVENYTTFVAKFQTKYPNSTKVFFPNVEFRIDSKNRSDDHIQVHVIFSNIKETTNKLTNFFTRLKLVSTDDENLTNKYCIETDLAAVTYKKAMVKIDDLCVLLKSNFSDQEYLIIGVATGYGSLRPTSGDGRGSEYAKEIDKMCQLFFGSKDNVDFYLNKIEGRAQYKLAPKAVVSGCDAHSFESLDEKLGHSVIKKDGKGQITDLCEITWIKANPTFEGLRQIIFEPEDRVSLQELIPDDKELYRVIDKIILSDTNFTSTQIELNPNLNVIIGSRSSGKTTLLNSIAKAIDVSEFYIRNKGLVLIKEPPKANVFWLDGTESDNKAVKKGITYIPQNYINSLAEATEGNAPILAIAERALFDSEGAVSKKKEALNTKLEATTRLINNDIYQLFTLRKQISDQVEKIKKIGDKKGIEEQIKKIEKEITKLQTGLTKKEVESLTKLRKDYSVNTKSVEILKADAESLSREETSLEDNNVFIDRDLDLKSEKLITEFDTFTKTNNKEYLEKYIAFIAGKKKDIVKEIKTLEDMNKKILEDNKTLIDKAKKNTSAEQKVKEKDVQDKKLVEIVTVETYLKAMQDSLIAIIIKIVGLHKDRSDARQEFVAIAKGELEGIEYGAVVDIDSVKLNKFITDFINIHNSIEAKDKLATLGYKVGDETTQSSLVKNANIKIIVDLILADTLKTKSGVDTQKAIEGIFSDFEFINYSLKYEEDNYSEMTPGKKSLVVLKLLVESSKDNYPILIDQPEDDLDSRSISTEIVEFLRGKKKQRQIILVTHNANIAIKADAEEIIVANRHGQQNKNVNDVMFDYITGAIENSFSTPTVVNALEKMGIREHACELLEGGEKAFENRRNKYNLK